MSIQVQCQDCAAEYDVSEDKAGMRIRCRECAAIVRIPAGTEPPSENSSPAEREATTAGILPFVLPVVPWLIGGAAAVGVLVGVWAYWDRQAAPDPDPEEIVERPTDSTDGTKEDPVDATPRKLGDLVTKDEKTQPTSLLEACREARRRFISPTRSISEFLRIIRPFTDEFPEVEVGTDLGSPRWQTVTLDPQGTGVGAFRFTSPLSTPANLDWAMSFDRHFWKWDVVPLEGKMAGFEDFPAKRNVLYENDRAELDAPFSVQRLHGGHIQPGTEYLIYFIPANPLSFELTLTIHLSEAAINDGNSSSESYAEAIGLRRRVLSAPPGSRLLAGHTGKVTGVVFLEDQTLLSCGVDGKVLRWDLQSERSPEEWWASWQSFDGIQLLDNGRVAAAHGQYTQRLSLFNTESGKLMQTYQYGRPIALTTPMQDPKRLLIYFHRNPDEEFQGGFGGVLTQLDPFDWNSRSSVNHDRASVYDMVAVPETDLAVLVGEWSRGPGEPDLTDGVQTLMSLKTKRVIDSVPRGDPPVSAVWAAPDGSRMTTTTLDGCISTCALPSMYDCYDVYQDEVVVACASFPDGERIAMAGRGGSVRIWNTSRRLLEFNRQASSQPLTSIAVSPDGRWIATAGQDSAVRLWDVDFESNRALDDEATNAFNNSLGMTMKRIPAGKFHMGTDEVQLAGLSDTDISSEPPQHPVRISRPFYMGLHEVTVGQFAEFVEASGYVTDAERTKLGQHKTNLEREMEASPELTWRRPGFEQEAGHPVVQISWNDAVSFCNWLSDHESAAYRLPTEAEWEYACRGGTRSLWSAHPDAVRSIANTADASLYDALTGSDTNVDPWNDRHAFTSPAGQFTANGFGLHDMQGNVLEWCADWYDSAYVVNPENVDPTGPSSGTQRVLRGGSFFQESAFCRPACRASGPPNLAQSCNGFRIVRDVSPSPPATTDKAALEDFLGVWEGKWDNLYHVRITVTTPADPDEGDAGFLYEWEERLGQPMRSLEGFATLEGGTLVWESVELTPNPLNPDRCTGLGRFFEQRTASLKRLNDAPAGDEPAP